MRQALTMGADEIDAAKYLEDVMRSPQVRRLLVALGEYMPKAGDALGERRPHVVVERRAAQVVTSGFTTPIT